MSPSSQLSSGAVMQHVAQPAGTPAALAVLNRGEDLLLIAHITYAFFIACKAMLHPKPIAGNHLYVQHSSVVGLIGQFFIVTVPIPRCCTQWRAVPIWMQQPSPR